MEKSEKQRIEKYKKQWEIAVSGFNKAMESIKKEARIDFRKMFNFLFFYQPQNKFDKVMHLIEMLIIYIFIGFILKGR